MGSSCKPGLESNWTVFPQGPPACQGPATVAAVIATLIPCFSRLTQFPHTYLRTFHWCTENLWVKLEANPWQPAPCLPCLLGHAEHKTMLELCWPGSFISPKMPSHERPAQSWPADWLSGGSGFAGIPSSTILGRTGSTAVLAYCRAGWAQPPCLLWVGM